MKHKRPEQPPVNSQTPPTPPMSPEEAKRMKQHERRLRREHHRARRWRYVASVLIILLALVIIALLLCMMFDYNPFDRSKGSGNGGGSGTVNTTGSLHENNDSTATGGGLTTPVPTESAETQGDTGTVVIKIDSTRIFLGEDYCEDVMSLRQLLLNKYDSETLIILASKTAELNTYQAVRDLLEDLQDAYAMKFVEDEDR